MDRIVIKGLEIGRGSARICAPLTGCNEAGIINELNSVVAAKPDIIEWRADYLDDTGEDNIIRILDVINKFVPDYPLIFTLRIDKEGGNKHISQKDRLRIIKRVIQTGKADIVDIELVNGDEFIKDIIADASNAGVFTILSYHDFVETPSKEKVLDVLNEMKGKGCSIAKVALMPNCIEDVLNVMEASACFADLPVIAIAMGNIGKISRIGAGVFGSCITFGALNQSTAPGQVSIEEMRNIMDILR